jgi:hypothetical protein
MIGVVEREHDASGWRLTEIERNYRWLIRRMQRIPAIPECRAAFRAPKTGLVADQRNALVCMAGAGAVSGQSAKPARIASAAPFSWNSVAVRPAFNESMRI